MRCLNDSHTIFVAAMPVFFTVISLGHRHAFSLTSFRLVILHGWSLSVQSFFIGLSSGGGSFERGPTFLHSLFLKLDSSCLPVPCCRNGCVRIVGISSLIWGGQEHIVIQGVAPRAGCLPDSVISSIVGSCARRGRSCLHNLAHDAATLLLQKPSIYALLVKHMKTE